MNKARGIHILHITSGDLWAGAEVQLFTLARSLSTLPNARVSVVLFNHGTLEQRLREAGFEVIVLDETRLNGFSILLGLVRVVRELKPDIIHTHRNKENILGSIAALLCGNIPTLRTAHGANEHPPAWYHVPKNLIRFLDWFCGRFFQRRIIAVSEDLAMILSSSFPASRIRVIENGIDAETLSMAARLRESRPKTGQTPFRLGIAGRLVPVKRVDLAIRSIRVLLNDHTDLDISLHIYGDGPLRDSLESLSDELNTGAAVHFEGYCDAMTQALASLDALLMTSDHEGLPMILLEAMVLQVPIIAHGVGGIPNLLYHGDCGQLVHKHTPEGYADAVFQLVSDPARRAALTANAVKRVKINYSAEKNAGAYFSVYGSLLPDRAHAAG